MQNDDCPIDAKIFQIEDLQFWAVIISPTLAPQVTCISLSNAIRGWGSLDSIVKQCEQFLFRCCWRGGEIFSCSTHLKPFQHTQSCSQMPCQAYQLQNGVLNLQRQAQDLQFTQTDQNKYPTINCSQRPSQISWDHLQSGALIMLNLYSGPSGQLATSTHTPHPKKEA